MIALSKAEGKQIFSGLPPKQRPAARFMTTRPNQLSGAALIGTVPGMV
jgi:hypothetical protein